MPGMHEPGQEREEAQRGLGVDGPGTASSGSADAANRRSVMTEGPGRMTLATRPHSRAAARVAQSAAPLGGELELDEPEEPEPEDSFFSLLFASCLSAPALADASISRLRLDVP